MPCCFRAGPTTGFPFPVDEDLFYRMLQEKIESSTVSKEDRDTLMEVKGTF